MGERNTSTLDLLKKATAPTVITEPQRKCKPIQPENDRQLASLPTILFLGDLVSSLTTKIYGKMDYEKTSGWNLVFQGLRTFGKDI